MKTLNVINENINLLTLFIRYRKTNPVVLGLLFSECYYTNRFKRVIEYLSWIVLSICKSKRKYTLSVGISQIQIRYWLVYGVVDDRLSIRNLKAFLNAIKNYELAEKIVIDSGVSCNDDSKVLAMYRGESRAHHLKVFKEIKKRIISSHLMNRY